MSLNPLRLKTLGAVAIPFAALAACGDPEARTDLRPEGDPEVLAVLVLNDSVSGLIEAATYCAPGDEKRPGLVGLPDFTTTQVCPDDKNEAAPMLTDAAPDTFYVRIMFDELLDPDVEELIEVLGDDGQPTGTFEGSLANTQPVILKCTGVDGKMYDVPYDGYYSPSGNNVTWPLGPSLVIKQTGDFIVPTNSACTIEVKDSVKDKSGNSVPMAQRGPFPFKVAPIKPIFMDSGGGSDSGDPAKPVEIDASAVYFENAYVQFNTQVQPASIACDDGTNMDECEFVYTPEIGECSTDGAPCEIQKAGADCATAGDTCDSGGLYSYTYFAAGAPESAKAEFGFGPNLPVLTDKTYTFSLKQGAKIKDQCGVETTLGAPDPAKNSMVTYHTRKFGLRNAGAQTPSTGDTVTGQRKVNIKFNNQIDFSSLDLTEWSIEPALFIPATTTVCATNADCPGFRGGGGECRMFGTPINGMRCVTHYTTSLFDDGDIVWRGHQQLNTEYTFTLKAGATVKDFWGAEYTNPADKVIKYKTQPALAITASTPANASKVVKLTPTSTTSVTFTFNQAMDVTSLTTDDYTLSPNTVALTPATAAVSPGAPASCSASATSCGLRLVGTYPPGEYTLTLKAGAVIKDVFGNDYTQAADRVIKFTVEETPPVTPKPCLGAP